jgi:MFS family permease
MVARSLPAFLLGPIAGVLVDRFRRKNVLVGMDVLRLVLVGFSIWLLRTGETMPIVPIYLVLVGISAADIFHSPARLALIPSLVKSNELVRANSFIMVTRQVILALSYTVGGWLLLAVSLQQIALGVALLFVAAIVAGMLIAVPVRISREGDSLRESFWQSLVSGWHYLRQHPIARPLTVMEMWEHIPHGIWTGALLLAFATKGLGGDSADWGYIVTGYFVGMIVGSLGTLAINDWLTRIPGRIIVISACSAGFLTLAFAFSSSVWMAVVVGLLFGPPFAVRDVAQDALLQSTVSENQLGRVYATRETLRNVVYMVAGIFFAWLSDYMPIRDIYVIGGIMYLLTGLYALSNKPLRESKMAATQATNI